LVWLDCEVEKSGLPQGKPDFSFLSFLKFIQAIGLQVHQLQEYLRTGNFARCIDWISACIPKAL